jgi:hypothetical protein
VVSWKDEFERRIRLAAGAGEDAQDFRWTEQYEEGYDGCDTCGYGGSEGRAYVECQWFTTTPSGSRDWHTTEFDTMADLLNAMDGVE